MKQALVVLSVVLGLAQCTPVEQTVIFNEDGSYRFNFDTGKDAGSIARHEERQADGTVIGRYSYEDPTGSVRVVNYRAGRQGFVATGDVGVAGAPQAQVPAVLPPSGPPQEEPSQELHPVAPAEEPPKPVPAQEHVQEEPEPGHADDEAKVAEDPAEEKVKVVIPEEPGRKREAGNPPPYYYTDNFFPFAAPMFGKRRLDIPEEEEKTQSDDDGDSKKQQDTKAGSSVDSHFPSSYVNPFISSQPQHKPEDKKAEIAPAAVKPPEYFYYVPVAAPQYGFLPSAPQPFQNFAGQGQNFAGQGQVGAQPKAWAYVPLSVFGPQQKQHQQVSGPQPGATGPQTAGGPPTSWIYIQPDAVNYIPGDKDQQDQTTPTPPPSGFPSSTTPVPVSSAAIPEQKVAAFQRPTVHHYHFRGPSHTYGYYYQY